MPLRFIAAALAIAACLVSPTALRAEPALKALIVDGQNNHGNWPDTTKMMKKYLEDTKLFTVDVATTAPQRDRRELQAGVREVRRGRLELQRRAWPKETQQAFIDYVKGGGGFVVVHAANNSFGDWQEYNEMIGLGGWGGRNEKSGPYVYLDEAGKLVRDEAKGSGGHHGPQHPFQIIVRDARAPDHQGHAQGVDARERRAVRPAPRPRREHAHPGHRLRRQGQGGHRPPRADDLHASTTARAASSTRRWATATTRRNASASSRRSIRGTEWAATGKVTLPVPGDFPTADKTSQRKFGE